MKNLPYYHYKTAAVTCSNCNWNGLGSQLKIGEHYSALFELDCPKCDHKVAMVGMPSFEEVLKDGTIVHDKNPNQHEINNLMLIIN